MDQNTGTLILAVGSVCSVVFGGAGYLIAMRKDSYSTGSDKGKLETDIAYIKHRTDDVLLEQKDTNKSINALAERVTRVEESSKQAHLRINTIEERVDKL